MPGPRRLSRGCGVPRQTGLRPHGRLQLRRGLRHGGRGGGGQPGNLAAGFTGLRRTELSLHVALKRTGLGTLPRSFQTRRGAASVEDLVHERTSAVGGQGLLRSHGMAGGHQTSQGGGTQAPESRQASSQCPGDSATWTGAPGTITCGPDRPFLLRCPVPRTGQRALGGGGTIYPPRQAEKVRVQR